MVCRHDDDAILPRHHAIQCVDHVAKRPFVLHLVVLGSLCLQVDIGLVDQERVLVDVGDQEERRVDFIGRIGDGVGNCGSIFSTGHVVQIPIPLRCDHPCNGILSGVVCHDEIRGQVQMLRIINANAHHLFLLIQFPDLLDTDIPIVRRVDALPHRPDRGGCYRLDFIHRCSRILLFFCKNGICCTVSQRTSNPHELLQQVLVCVLEYVNLFVVPIDVPFFVAHYVHYGFLDTLPIVRGGIQHILW